MTDLHVFESRTEAFEAVLQETVITAGTRGDPSPDSSVRLTISGGSADIGASRSRTLPIDEVVRGNDRTHRIVHLPADERDDRVRRIVSEWTGSLRKLGLSVSTGPVVAFRAKEFLRHEQDEHTVPLLWLQHVKAMASQWPLATRKPEHIEDVPSSRHLLLANRNYVLLRRFTAKEEARRLVAAPYFAEDLPCERVGLENHLNYIHRPNGALGPDECVGLAAVLNSQLLDAYVRISSGNTPCSCLSRSSRPTDR